MSINQKLTYFVKTLVILIQTIRNHLLKKKKKNRLLGKRIHSSGRTINCQDTKMVLY